MRGGAFVQPVSQCVPICSLDVALLRPVCVGARNNMRAATLLPVPTAPPTINSIRVLSIFPSFVMLELSPSERVSQSEAFLSL